MRPPLRVSSVIGFTGRCRDGSEGMPRHPAAVRLQTQRDGLCERHPIVPRSLSGGGAPSARVLSMRLGVRLSSRCEHVGAEGVRERRRAVLEGLVRPIRSLSPLRLLLPCPCGPTHPASGDNSASSLPKHVSLGLEASCWACKLAHAGRTCRLTIF